jgi:hypothetical protein
MARRLVVLSETDEVAARALADLQVRKDPAVFAERSVVIGERLGIALRENEEDLSSMRPPIYYKLRDARYVWHGLRQAIPEARGQAIFTQRQGQGYSSVEIDATVTDISDLKFTAFLDPMLARGTTAISVSDRIIRGRSFRRFATLHCFASEEGIGNLQTRLSDFADDYLLIVGKRGFHVDPTGYMGAIRREMDWGDVQEGTYFLEYPAEKEIEVVLGELGTSGGQDIVMATVLMILRAHEQHHRALNSGDPALPTDGFIHTMMCLMKEDRLPIPVASSEWKFGGFYPRSEAVRRAILQLQAEDFVKRLHDEAYPTYVLSPWGHEYLQKVYMPALAQHVDGLHYQLVDAVQETVEKSVSLPFGDLVRRAQSWRRRLPISE